jgi:hypothetical protein
MNTMETDQQEKKWPRFAVMTLMFYGEGTILRMIDNCGPFVEKIYVGFSEVPWSEYNKKARQEFKASATVDILKASKWADKIVVIQGVWPSDEAERNAILDRARADGMDYLIVQDADEFYTPESYRQNLEGIAANPNHPVYRCPWIVFWKTTDYVLTCRNSIFDKPTPVTTCPNYAVNCKMPDVYFSKSRLINRMGEAFMLDGLCLHLSWVLDDELVLKKVLTWGHSHQFNGKKWYQQKWLAWAPGETNLGHITRVDFGPAIKYKVDLPEELKNLPALKQDYVPLNFIQRIDSRIRDYSSIFVWYLKLIRFKSRQLFHKI